MHLKIQSGGGSQKAFLGVNFCTIFCKPHLFIAMQQILLMLVKLSSLQKVWANLSLNSLMRLVPVHLPGYDLYLTVVSGRCHPTSQGIGEIFFVKITGERFFFSWLPWGTYTNRIASICETSTMLPKAIRHFCLGTQFCGKNFTTVTAAKIK
jgi:hypothetical protein